MTHTTKRDWLANLIGAAERPGDCDHCGLYPCPEHAADAVLNAVRSGDLFMLERSAADQVIWQARHDELLAASDEALVLVEELSDKAEAEPDAPWNSYSIGANKVVIMLLGRARVARNHAIEDAPPHPLKWGTDG